MILRPKICDILLSIRIPLDSSLDYKRCMIGVQLDTVGMNMTAVYGHIRQSGRKMCKNCENPITNIIQRLV